MSHRSRVRAPQGVSRRNTYYCLMGRGTAMSHAHVASSTTKGHMGVRAVIVHLMAPHRTRAACDLRPSLFPSRSCVFRPFPIVYRLRAKSPLAAKPKSRDEKPAAKWVHSSVVRAADCRSAGPWFKSGCALSCTPRSLSLLRHPLRRTCLAKQALHHSHKLQK